jgi:hypothetical protein
MPHFLQQHTPIPYLKSASEQHKVSSNPTSALIQANDGTDGIVLKSLPFADAAFTSIDAIKDTLINGSWDLSTANKIDVHAHAVPNSYSALVPLDQAQPTSEWSILPHYQHTLDNGIAHSIMSISTLAKTVFAGNETLSVGLARLLNEYLAELTIVFSERFSFYSVTPLPYIDASLREVNYALGELGARGVGC